MLTAVQAVFAPKLIQFTMPGVAAAACIIAGLALWAAEWRAPLAERARLIADSSYATATLVVGIALALVGVGFGLWLILIGAGVAAFGVGGVLREQRARGRTLHRSGRR
jgi:hypothetical protein